MCDFPRASVQVTAGPMHCVIVSCGRTGSRKLALCGATVHLVVSKGENGTNGRKTAGTEMRVFARKKGRIMYRVNEIDR